MLKLTFALLCAGVWTSHTSSKFIVILSKIRWVLLSVCYQSAYQYTFIVIRYKLNWQRHWHIVPDQHEQCFMAHAELELCVSVDDRKKKFNRSHFVWMHFNGIVVHRSKRPINWIIDHKICLINSIDFPIEEKSPAVALTAQFRRWYQNKLHKNLKSGYTWCKCTSLCTQHSHRYSF